MSEQATPLSDSLYEKLCEARRYPGSMITHAWDARLQEWITQAMAMEADRATLLARIPKWISVEDRLPNNWQRVLVCDEEDQDATQLLWFDATGKCWRLGGSAAYNLLKLELYSHWMPLPRNLTT